MADRIANHNLKIEHKKEEIYEKLEKDELPNSPFYLHEGLIKTKLDSKIFIPASLEGTVLAYCHLITGHTGWVRLYSYARQKFFFPDLKEKVKNIAITCQICLLANPGTKRRPPMKTVLSTYPNEIVSCDLLEVESIQGSRTHKILVVSDYHSKAIFCYDLVSFTGKDFIAKFKEFLTATGLVTKVLIVDNASIFSSSEVLTFLTLVGIRKVRGNANHSESRGLVEGSIRILQTLIRKMLSLSKKYDYESILFLAPVLLNRAVNPITGYTPYEMLMGRDISALGPLGVEFTQPEYRLFSDTIKKDLQKLRSLLEDRIETVADQIKQQKEKLLEKINKDRPVRQPIEPGSIVFIRNFSIPKSRRDRKFRTYYLRSPQIVLSATETSVVTIRLADSFVSRHHPSSVLEYRGNEKDEKLHRELPDEVLRFLGSPMTGDSLARLAKNDKLDIIYQDRILPEVEPTMTRSKRRKQEEEERAMQLAQLAADAEDSEDLRDLNVSAPPSTPRQVTFSDNVDSSN